jgi:hypothetical protein
MMSEENKKKKVSLIQDYIRVFSTVEGQNVLKDLMEKGYLLRPTYSSDPYEAARNEGKRELLLYILSNNSYDVQSLIDLIDDSKNEERNTSEVNNEEQDFDFFKD